MGNKVVSQSNKKGLIGNITTLFLGYSSAEVIAIIAYPIISRLYTPQDFGKMSILWAYCSIFGAIACWRLESVIVIEPSHTRAQKVTELCFWGAIIQTVLVVSLLTLSPYLLSQNYLREDQLDLLFWAGPASVLASGLYLMLSNWSVRHKRFRGIFLARLTGVVSSALLKIFYGMKIGSSATILLGANIFSSVVQVIVLLPFYFTSRSLHKKEESKTHSFTSILKEYKGFPTTMLSSTLISSLTTNLPNIILGYYYSSNIVGYFGFAFAILVRPTGIIAESISKVLLQDLSKEKMGKRGKKVLKITIILVLVGLPFLAIFSQFGEQIFSKLFGGNWSEAGKYAEVLSIYIFGRIVMTPAAQLMVLEKQVKFNFWCTFFESVARLFILMSMAVLEFSPIIVIATYAFAGFLIHAIYVILALYKHNNLTLKQVN